MNTLLTFIAQALASIRRSSPVVIAPSPSKVGVVARCTTCGKLSTLDHDTRDGGDICWCGEEFEL